MKLRSSQKSLRFFSSVSLFLITFIVAVGFSNETKAGGTLKFGMIEDAISLDPIIPSDNESIWTQLLIFDQLVRTGVNGTEVEPGLAGKWSVSENGLEYTFNLRDAKFSNGQPVTAEDVVYSLNRAAGENSRWASFFKPIKNVVAVDAKTVKLILKEQFTPILSTLGLFSASIVPKSVVEAGEKNFANNPIGSGPFKLEKWGKGEKIVLVKNSYYWQPGKPHIDGVEFYIEPEDNTRMLKLQNGELDIAANVPFNMIKTFEKNKDIDIQVTNVLRSDFILMNTTKKPFNDIKVRHALNLAIDKEQIIQTILFGMGKIAKSSLPIMKYYNHDIVPYESNLEKAKKLLTEAGYPDGFSATLLVISGQPVANQTAVVVQDAYRKLGIDLKISVLEGGTHWETTKSGNYDMALSYCTSDTIDPDQIVGFTMLTPGRADSYHTRYSDPKINELFEKGRKVLDSPEREAIYKEIQSLHYQDAPFVFLYHIPAVYGVRSSIKEFIVCATANYRLEEVNITGN